MTLPELCIKRPVFTTMLILLPVVLGLVGLSKMGVDLFPNVDLPIVFVTTTRQGASAEEMETGVTKKIEEAVNTLASIDELTSVSKEGISVVNIRFLLEKNRDVAQQEVQSKINAIISQLPTGTDTPIIDKFDLDAAPVMSIAVSGKRSIREVTEIADKQISQSLSSLPGVGSVTLTGGLKRAIQVTLNSDKLHAYNLSVDDVRGALARQNLELPGGRVDQNSRELTLRTMGRIVDTRDFNEIILATIAGQPIRVRDVGEAKDDVEEPRSEARLDGLTAVNLIVQKQSGSNTVQVIDGVKARLQVLETAFAAQGKGDIRMEVIRDQSIFIKASMHEVEKHLVLGALLVSLTILLFLRDWRTMIMASIAIPVSIIGTFLCMYVMGFTLNNMTMLALVMAIGIVIDDAVVVHENIFRWMEEKGLSAREAALGATKEIALAVMATTFSLVVIFLPIAFMAGTVGRFFQSYGISMAFAIMVSLCVSFSLTPMLCSRFLSPFGVVRVWVITLMIRISGRGAVPHGDLKTRICQLRDEHVWCRWILPNPRQSHHSAGVYGYIAEKPYLRALRWSLGGKFGWHRLVIVGAALAIVVSLFPLPVGNWISAPARDPVSGKVGALKLAWANYPGLASMLGMDFIPQDDQSEFEVAITTPSGYTLERTLATLNEIASRMKALPGVTHTLVNIGDTTGKLTRATGDVTKGSVYVRMVDLEERPAKKLKGVSQFDLMARARKVMAEYPDLRSSVQMPTMVGGGATNSDVEFTLSGPDLEKLNTSAKRIMARMREVPGLTDVDTTTPERNPEVRVYIDRNRASELGLSVEQIASALQTLVGGQVVSDYKDTSNGEQYDVWLRAKQSYRATQEAINGLTISSPKAGLVELSNVARLAEGRGPAQIDHFMRQRKMSIVCNLAFHTKHNQFLLFQWDRWEKMPTGEAVGAIQKILGDMRESGELTPDYTVDFLGRAKTMGQTVSSFLMAFSLSLILMYMILAAQFESFVHPITILLAVPLTLPFAAISLIILGQSANLYAIIGTFLLFGIVKKNGILQVDYTNQLRAKGMAPIPAIMEANKTRLRPILMTTVMLVASMTPIALGQGAGAASRASMAKVIIGGQTLSLLLSLLVTPVAYTLFVDLGVGAGWVLGELRHHRPAEVVEAAVVEVER